MKRSFLGALALMFLQGAALAALNVVATLTEIGALVEEVGGTRVKVESLARGDEDPHSIAAKPSHSRRMSKADLLVYNGLELEIGWLPLLIEGARNPRILEGNSSHLNLSDFIHPLEIPEFVDRSLGDVHPEGNPHFTLDPGLYPDLARVLSERLAVLDPDGADYYAERLDSFVQRWNRRLLDWQQRLEPLKGVEVVAYHNLWSYAARRFDFEIIGHVEDRPGIPPTPKHVAVLQTRVRAENVKLLLYSDLVHPEIPKRFAERAGCKSLRLPQSVNSREDTENLFDWFELWVSLLEGAIKEG